MVTNFVFSSVGDNTNFDTLWVDDNNNKNNSVSNYHVFVIYYGDNDEVFNRYKSRVHFIEQRKGSKFQNFKYFYDKYPEIIEKYERFFILDDDIIFDVNDINKMFDISTLYNLQICGPSFTNESKISHNITRHKKGVLLTYTNFVEVNVPLFTKHALNQFMGLLDSSLIGWGIDVFYMWRNGLHKKNAYAIVHGVTCTNPPDVEKTGKKRELELISGCQSRRDIWKTFALHHGCPCWYMIKEYKNIVIIKYPQLD